MLALYRIPNGYARRHGCRAEDVDPSQLRIGTKVEMEHTSDPKIARQVALDHICESKGRPYYVPADVKHEQLLLKREEYPDGLGDCRVELVKFRDSRGKLVQFRRRVGSTCRKRQPSTRHLKPYQYRRKEQLGDASCSTSPRWVRGGVGFLIGTMLGGMIGGGIALAVTTTQFDPTEPISAVSRAKNMAAIAAGIAVLGAAGGLAAGAWKPEC